MLNVFNCSSFIENTTRNCNVGFILRNATTLLKMLALSVYFNYHKEKKKRVTRWATKNYRGRVSASTKAICVVGINKLIITALGHIGLIYWSPTISKQKSDLFSTAAKTKQKACKRTMKNPASISCCAKVTASSLVAAAPCLTSHCTRSEPKNVILVLSTPWRIRRPSLGARIARKTLKRYSSLDAVCLTGDGADDNAGN